MKCYEVNFDALVGPTHNYSGLALGNIASKANQMSPSNPRSAALQGLEKMRFLSSLGIKQGIIPPQPRPHIETLSRLGYHGNDSEILTKAWQDNPELVMAVTSSASMWAANSATVTPSCDSEDGRVQITPANLSSKFHRSIEAGITAKILKRIFADSIFFKHHPPLPSGTSFSDEGAANHTCFNKKYGTTGVHLFVYGCSNFNADQPVPKKFPPRQTLEASQAIARLHQLPPHLVVYVQQNPEAIDAGVFHNDVIAVGNNNVLLYHESAFYDSESAMQKLQKAVASHCRIPLIFIKASESEIPIKDVVKSYLFNSQLITMPDGSMALIAPTDCQKIPSVMGFLTKLIQDTSNPINQVHYFNLNESMRNGGGPACLRLRVILTENELHAVNQRFLFTEELYNSLSGCIQKYYRSEIIPSDLGDPQFLKESHDALEAIYKIFGIDTVSHI